jgi:flagellar basal-body rod modification protein FlgD
MISNVGTSSAQSSSNGNSSTAQSSTGTPVDKNMFLTLMVAQLKNQDPMNPADSTQFLTQLAQFQQLEQSINLGQDLTSIRQSVETYFPVDSSTDTDSTSAA